MTYLLFGLALAALLYQISALLSMGRFFGQAPPSQPSASSASQPGVTIFKPIKGLEAQTYECLASFTNLDYQPVQVLFGVSDLRDPVLPVLENLKENSPHQIEIIGCPENLGLNPKVSLLRQLEPYARHDVWVIADSDVKVGRDFLSTVVTALKETGVGLVSCPYRSGPAHTLGARLEALTISADFIPSVAMAHYVEGIRFALGATIALPSENLKRIGGFAALADFLADDYQLGWQVHESGARVAVVPYVVETTNPEMSLKDYVLHQLRWTRTYRVCRPKGYLAYGITHALVWSTAAWLASGLAPFALGLVGATLVVRLTLAFFSERYCLGGQLPASTLFILPLKDLFSFCLWLLSFLGNQVTWKGARFRLTKEGKLVPMGDEKRKTW